MASSDAERQQNARDRRKAKEREEIATSLDGAPDYVLAVAIGEWDDGYEARMLTTREKYSHNFLYVSQHGLLIVDEDGFYNWSDSREGRRLLSTVMVQQRNEIQDYLIEHLSEDVWRSHHYDAARRKLKFPTGRTIREVADTLEAINSDKDSKVEQAEPEEMNNYRLIMFNNGVVDTDDSPMQLLEPDVVKTKRSMRPEIKGRADFVPNAHLENNDACDKLADLIVSHSHVLRYVWSLLKHGGEKEAGYIEAEQSDAGKSTILAILQEATGQVGIADRKIMHSGSRFNHLEALMAKFLLVAIDEADKFEQISPHIINSSINSGRVHLEEKFAKPIAAMRKANLLFVAGGPVNLDWHAQGIVPDNDGRGGRFKSMVTIDGAMDKELGAFLNLTSKTDERQGMLTALIAFLTDPGSQWTAEDEAAAYNDLMAMVGTSYEDWQSAIMDVYMQGTDDQWIASRDIKATIDDVASKAPSDKSVAQFLKKTFNASKQRLPRKEGQGRAWFGMTLRQADETAELDLEEGSSMV